MGFKKCCEYKKRDRKRWKKRRNKRRIRGIDGAFSWRCCFASKRYQLDFSNVNDPCIPERVMPFRHCGC